MNSRRLVNKLFEQWRSFKSLFFSQKTILKPRTIPVKRSSLRVDFLEDRTAPAVLWGMADLVITGIPDVAGKPFHHSTRTIDTQKDLVPNQSTQSIDLTKYSEAHRGNAARIDAMLVYNHGQISQVPFIQTTSVNLPLPTTDSVFAQLGENQTESFNPVYFNSLKHQTESQPLAIGAMVLVSVPLVMSEYSRDRSTGQTKNQTRLISRSISV